MTNTVITNERETTAAARRRVAAAERARDWREKQRVIELTREAENVALRKEVAALKAERDQLQAALGHTGATASIDEDLVRAVVKMGAICRSTVGLLAVSKPQVSVSDIIAVAGYIRCGGRQAGQAAFDAARMRVLERVAQFVPLLDEA